jgi:hypothetical protein
VKLLRELKPKSFVDWVIVVVIFVFVVRALIETLT